MGNALIYEYLMRAAFNTDRHGANGRADADVYRDMEQAIRETTLQKEAIKKREVPVSTKSIDQLEYDARVAISRIRTNVSGAIDEVLKNTRMRHSSQETQKKLRDLQAKLSYTEFSKTTIDDVISQVLDIFRENKLE